LSEQYPGRHARVDLRRGILDQLVQDLDQSLACVATASHRVDDLEVYVVDNVLSQHEAELYQQELSRRSYQLREYDFAGDEYPIFSTEYSKQSFLSESHPSLRILTMMRNLFPTEAFRLNRAYVNLSRYGDMEYPHRDCSENARDLTALFYGHPDWKAEYGGQTMFYHSGTDPALAVTPRPGRLVIFRGAILHLGSVPTRVCRAARYSLVLKFGSRPAVC
jgi:Rps23 Pro-64 3,4-dihydroxylase Tpa1-like proline 4-hydroxylase